MSAPTTELELVETAEEADDGKRLLHAYCTVCMAVAAPEPIRSMCGQGRPGTDDDMLYDGYDQCPPEEMCVVCAEMAGQPCPKCGV